MVQSSCGCGKVGMRGLCPKPIISTYRVHHQAFTARCYISHRHGNLNLFSQVDASQTQPGNKLVMSRNNLRKLNLHSDKWEDVTCVAKFGKLTLKCVIMSLSVVCIFRIYALSKSRWVCMIKYKANYTQF